MKGSTWPKDKINQEPDNNQDLKNLIITTRVN